MKILVVDDQQDTRMILTKILESAGHKVVSARNGRDALDLVAAKAPDMIVSDILMPVLDGYHLCRQVKADDRFSDILFVFYTATYTDEQDERFARDLGADGFIIKPVDPQTFVDRISRLVADAQKERLTPATPVPMADQLVEDRHSERLVAKLEAKMRELEAQVSERRMLQKQLTEANQRLRGMFEAMPDMIFRMDREGRFLEFKAAREFPPYLPPEQFMGRKITDVLPAELANRAVANIAKALDTDKTVLYAYQLDVDGEPRDYEARYAACGKDQVVTLVRDITARRQAERELAGSEARYRSLVESSADHIFVLSADGIFLASNKRCIESHCPPGETIVGRSLEVFHSSQVAAVYMENVRQVVRSGETVRFEHEMRIDDRLHWHTDTLYPLYQGDAIWAVGGVCRDITEQKHAEMAIVESERKYRTLFENSQDAISIATEQGRFLDTNPAFRRLFGYSREEIGSVNARDLWVDPVQRDDCILKAKNGYVKDHQVRLRKKDGTELICQSAIAVRAEGADQPVTLYSITRDITAYRRMEDQLRQSQKMEAVGRLAGGVAHDFNNMLSVIIGYTETAIAGLNPVDPIHADLEEVHKAALRSADLTRQLLAFSRQQAIAPQVIDLNGQLEGMQRMLERIIGEDIELTFSLVKGLPPVFLDPGQVDQVAANLVVNSRDAMPDGGQLLVETAAVSLDEAACAMLDNVTPGDYVMLAVSDTGCGMDRATLEKAFDPFFTTKGPGRGTGLGLATVYGIAKQNAGTAAIYSEPAKGTTVKVYFPVCPEAKRQQPAAAPAEKAPGGTETILLVEDEASLRKLAGTMLQRAGYKVIAADSPRQALSICRDRGGSIDLLLTDVVMPEMDGKSLEAELRSLYPKIKTVFMSGYTSDAVLRRGILDREVMFLQKPFTRDSLVTTIRQALDQ